jgi:two-component system, LytTR family, response regulator
MNLLKPPYSCIIVDDDEVDRLTTVSFARRFPILRIDGIFASTEEALNGPGEDQVQVMLLDIDLPGLSGLEFRRRMMNVPVCIFITAYTEHAMKSFELAAFDFLEKPLSTDRFSLSMRRLEEYMDTRQKASLFDISLGGNILYIKDGHDQIKIKLHEVLYLEALKDYTKIVTVNKDYCVISSIGNLLKEKTFETFLRIHRSYAVQKNFIKKITANTLFINDVELPIGRSYKDLVRTFK